MKVREAAARMEISLSLLYRLIEEGRIPHRRIGQRGRRGKIILLEEDVKAFMESAKVQAE